MFQRFSTITVCVIGLLCAGFFADKLPDAAGLPVGYRPAGLPAPRPALVEALRYAMVTDVAAFCPVDCDYQTMGNEAVVSYSQSLDGFRDYFTPLLKSETAANALYEWVKPGMRQVWQNMNVRARAEYRRSLLHLNHYLAGYDHAAEKRYWKLCQENPNLSEAFFVRYGPEIVGEAERWSPTAARFTHPKENQDWRFEPAKAVHPLLNNRNNNFRRLEAFVFRRIESGVSLALIKKFVETLINDFPLAVETDDRKGKSDKNIVEIENDFETATIENGFLNGDYAAFHRNKKIWQEGAYTNGQKDGEWLYYLPNGALVKTETYKNGVLNGKTLIERPEGFWYHGFYRPEPATQEIVYENGWTKQVKFYRPNDEVFREEVYDTANGATATVKLWEERDNETVVWSGEEKYQAFYLASPAVGVFLSAGYLRSGLWKETDEKGKIILAEERYEDGARKGAAAYYLPNGQKIKSVSYRGAEGEDPYPVFDFVGRFLNGESVIGGNYALYTPKGNLYITGENIHDPVMSAWTVYHYDEQEKRPVAEERYQNGLLEGKCRYFDATGELKYELIFKAGKLYKARGNCDGKLPSFMRRFTPLNDKNRPDFYVENTKTPAEGRLVNCFKTGLWQSADGSESRVYKYGFEHNYFQEAESRRRFFVSAKESAAPPIPDDVFDDFDHAMFFLRFRRGLPFPSIPRVGEPEQPSFDWKDDSTGLATAIPKIYSQWTQVVLAYDRHLALFPDDEQARYRRATFLLENDQKEAFQQSVKQLDLNKFPDLHVYLYRSLSPDSSVNKSAVKHIETYLKTNDDNGKETLANSPDGYRLAAYFAKNKKTDFAFQLLNLRRDLKQLPRQRLETDFAPILADPRWVKLME